jgi:hypothetical protein
MRKRPQARFGIGEWYGKSFIRLGKSKRKAFAGIQGSPECHKQICPFQTSSEKTVYCNKVGGVCSLRLYVKDAQGKVSVADPPRDRLRCTCPNRFKEGQKIYEWVGETMLGQGQLAVLKEIPFLESTIPPEVAGEEAGEVGLIDNILVVSDSYPLRWCAVEIQAVYFSGAAMGKDFQAIHTHGGSGIPFPVGNRHPDYRSSAPKRLMPQLQIKVPSLRRWGKKMAVVIDQDFFNNMAPMEKVKDVSNCDVAWFIVRFDESQGEAVLTPDKVYLTTLEQSVEGLTAGIPVSLAKFEERMREKINALH